MQVTYGRYVAFDGLACKLFLETRNGRTQILSDVGSGRIESLATSAVPRLTGIESPELSWKKRVD